jgi:hypothetical protein
MPTEAEFDTAARLFDAAAEEATTLAAGLLVSIGPDVLSGGVLADTVDAEVRDGDREANATGGDLRELAEECRRRAEMVRQLAADLAAHEAAVRQYEADLVRLSDAQPVPAWHVAPMPPGPAPVLPPWAEV